MLWVGLQCVIVVFLDRTLLLFIIFKKLLKSIQYIFSYLLSYLKFFVPWVGLQSVFVAWPGLSCKR